MLMGFHDFRFPGPLKFGPKLNDQTLTLSVRCYTDCNTDIRIHDTTKTRLLLGLFLLSPMQLAGLTDGDKLYKYKTLITILT